MKLNKNIVIAAVAGITTLSPIINQSSVVLADVAQSNQQSQNTTNTNPDVNNVENQNTNTTDENNGQNADNPNTTAQPINAETPPPNEVVETNQDKDQDPEPKINMRKEKKAWSTRHKKANLYYNENIKKGQKLTNKKLKVKLYKNTLKHFKNYKTNYAKRFKKYLNAEIAWLNRQIKKDVPTTKPSGDLAPQPVNPPKKEPKHHEGWIDAVLYENYLDDYKYYRKNPKINKPFIEKVINALKKRGYKFNADLSDKGYEAHNKALAKRDMKLIDEGKLK